MDTLSTGFRKYGYGSGLQEARPKGVVPNVGAGFIPARCSRIYETGGDKPRPYRRGIAIIGGRCVYATVFGKTCTNVGRARRVG